MNDLLQQGLEALVRQSSTMRAIAIFCAAAIVYLMGAAWLTLTVYQKAHITVATVMRVALLALLGYLASTVLSGVVADPRPYIVAHTAPPIPVKHDNGFPSDHTLLAAILTASLWWIARAHLPLFASATLLVALGRLAIGAHHTLDVVGSMGIAVIVTLIVAALPLPHAWEHHHLLPSRPPRMASRLPTASHSQRHR